LIVIEACVATASHIRLPAMLLFLTVGNWNRRCFWWPSKVWRHISWHSVWWSNRRSERAKWQTDRQTVR